MNRRDIGSDLAGVDAHVIQPDEYDEVPELDDDFFDSAMFHVGGLRVDPKEWWAAQRKVEHAEVDVDLQLDVDVAEHFKAAGANWQLVVNAVLRAAMEKQASAAAQTA